ncbi:MAG TPA: 50S ribosome-binding GTPase [Caldisericia bacterium]|nr:50S ribosome-binding GTPase [Caldisericia bacterium]HPF48877.1 50S ribosome-binding GTPase [Caldisericia bacterium]HPI83259.1 50S ribosome-binding GTPase [Caldisericia bacterium]HPQ92486.1 50S ribosome-binding GTPase [Caldisericia bacterium]HRV74416.1 50S ribosome-binding GTPase [Caldisericia bacterium]
MDTIVSPATALVPQAVGIVRLSGERSHEIAKKMINPPRLPEPGCFAFRQIINPLDKSIIDEGLVLCFQKPHSFTGEDSIEFQVHGSPAVLDMITNIAVSLGARKANPGEFSYRAFLFGKSSLPHLELANALANMSNLNQMGLGVFLATARKELEEIYSSIEAAISFPDDVSDNNSFKTGLNELLEKLISVRESCQIGDLPKVIIAGPPNAGKSTLFNHLMGFNRMVVSSKPGTTRDYVSSNVRLFDANVTLIDSPGLDDDSDDSGQQLTKTLIDSADLIIWLDPEASTNVSIEKNAILVQSKSDTRRIDDSKWMQLSTHKKYGIDQLIEKIKDHLPKKDYIATTRQTDILKKMINSLKRALCAPSVDMLSFDIRECLTLMSELDGIGVTEANLERIFSTFCIGK